MSMGAMAYLRANEGERASRQQTPSLALASRPRASDSFLARQQLPFHSLALASRSRANKFPPLAPRERLAHLYAARPRASNSFLARQQLPFHSLALASRSRANKFPSLALASLA
jgi:hypothetical protein